MGYVRNVEFQVKTGKTTEFNKLFSDEVLPMLKKQDGFKHELAMASDTHAVGISVWKDRSSAEMYQTKVYPDVLKKLSPLIEGSPRVQGYNLTTSTL